MTANPEALRQILDQARAFLASDNPTKLSEAETKAHFLDPLIASLGWSGIGVVIREYWVKSSGQYIDYVMTNNGRPLLAIEAKPLQSRLQSKDAAQVVQYCATEGIEWAVVTNGRELQFFNTFLKPDLEAKRVLSIDLLGYENDDEFASIKNHLHLLSTESLLSFQTAKWLAKSRMDNAIRLQLTDSGSPTLRALRKALDDSDLRVSPSELASWFNLILQKPSPVIRPPVPIAPTLNPSPIAQPMNVVSGLETVKQSAHFKGVHAPLFEVFEELANKVTHIAPTATWQVKKMYVAAEVNGVTFLAFHRRNGGLTIGLTLPTTLTRNPRLNASPKVFYWGRITGATHVVTTDQIDSELLQLIQDAHEFATGVERKRVSHKEVSIRDLIAAGLLQSGEQTNLRRGGIIEASATITSDGCLEWQGTKYQSPSSRAFSNMLGRKSLNGWTSWTLDRPSGRISLAQLRDQIQNGCAEL